MIMKKTLCLLLTLLSLSTKGKPINITAMGFFSSQSLYRGAQIWPYPTIMAGPGLLFLDKRIKLFGPSLAYDFFPNKEHSFKLKARVRYFDDDKP